MTLLIIRIVREVQQQVHQLQIGQKRYMILIMEAVVETHHMKPTHQCQVVL